MMVERKKLGAGETQGGRWLVKESSFNRSLCHGEAHWYVIDKSRGERNETGIALLSGHGGTGAFESRVFFAKGAHTDRQLAATARVTLCAMCYVRRLVICQAMSPQLGDSKLTLNCFYMQLSYLSPPLHQSLLGHVYAVPTEQRAETHLQPCALTPKHFRCGTPCRKELLNHAGNEASWCMYFYQ